MATCRRLGVGGPSVATGRGQIDLKLLLPPRDESVAAPEAERFGSCFLPPSTRAHCYHETRLVVRLNLLSRPAS